MKIYIISYKNEERASRMRNRLFGQDIIFTKEVHMDDERLKTFSDREKNNKIDFRTWSIMLQHMDAIREFYFSGENHCIVCEDDIYISKHFSNELEGIIKDFDEMGLDILMLGYLWPFKIDTNSYFPNIKKSDSYSYHSYPDDIWGTQMYMISRSYAKYLIDKFTLEYAYETIDTNPYSCDWIITKNGKRALIVPMIAVEEGVNLSGCYSQVDFHRRCFEVNYDSDKYI